MNSYQKLKAKNKELTKEINELVRDYESYQSIQIRCRYKFMQDFEKVVMAGAITTTRPNTRFYATR